MTGLHKLKMFLGACSATKCGYHSNKIDLAVFWVKCACRLPILHTFLGDHLLDPAICECLLEIWYFDCECYILLHVTSGALCTNIRYSYSGQSRYLKFNLSGNFMTISIISRNLVFHIYKYEFIKHILSKSYIVY